MFTIFKCLFKFFKYFVYYFFRPVRHDIPLAPQDAINDFEFPIIQQSSPPVFADDSNYNYDYHNYDNYDVEDPPPPPPPPLVPVFQPIPIQAGSLGSNNQGGNEDQDGEIENSTDDNNSDDFIDIMETLEDTTLFETNEPGKKLIVLLGRLLFELFP